MRVNMEVLGEANVLNFLSVDTRFNRKRAFERAGLQVETSARRKAPHKTGHLRRNIVSEVHNAYSKDPRDTYAEIGVSLTVVPYAWYQEAGTSTMQAHPYLRPGLASSKPAITAIFNDEMQKATKGGKA